MRADNVQVTLSKDGGGPVNDNLGSRLHAGRTVGRGIHLPKAAGGGHGERRQDQLVTRLGVLGTYVVQRPIANDTVARVKRAPPVTSPAAMPEYSAMAQACVMVAPCYNATPIRARYGAGASNQGNRRPKGSSRLQTSDSLEGLPNHGGPSAICGRGHLWA